MWLELYIKIRWTVQWKGFYLDNRVCYKFLFVYQVLRNLDLRLSPALVYFVHVISPLLRIISNTYSIFQNPTIDNPLETH
jgi:hypothetical protein